MNEWVRESRAEIFLFKRIRGDDEGEWKKKKNREKDKQEEENEDAFFKTFSVITNSLESELMRF